MTSPPLSAASSVLPGLPPGAPARRRRLLLIVNPTAGRRRGRTLRAVVAALAAGGADIARYETRFRGDAENYLAAVALQRFDAVLVAGGDGTINECLNGLMRRTAPPPPLGLIPMGTANVLAHELQLVKSPHEIAETLLTGAVREIHPGRANDRYFAMMAGVGLDAHVVAKIDPRLKRVLGKAAYALETWRQMATNRFPGYTAVLDGRTVRGGAMIAAKGHFYAGRFVCAKDARLGDPYLHLCVFLNNGGWAALGYGAALLANRVPHLRSVAVFPARTMTVAGPPGDPVQADGDIVAYLPVTLAVAEKTLRIIVGRDG
jgi:YegS/Rv2252/BmrU family lipid kinase